MEKEKLSNELQTMVGENNLSPQTWDKYIEKSVIPFLPNEEDKLKDFLSNHAEALKTLSGQYNFDIANKVNDFKKNYKPEQPTKAQNQPMQQTPVNANTEPSDALGTALERINSFMAEQEKRKADEVLRETQSKLIEDAKALAKTQGAVDELIVNLALSKLKISENETRESFAASLKTEYDKLYSELHGRGYTPAGNISGGASKGNFKSFKERKQKEGKLP